MRTAASWKWLPADCAVLKFLSFGIWKEEMYSRKEIFVYSWVNFDSPAKPVPCRRARCRMRHRQGTSTPLLRLSWEATPQLRNFTVFSPFFVQVVWFFPLLLASACARFEYTAAYMYLHFIYSLFASSSYDCGCQWYRGLGVCWSYRPVYDSHKLCQAFPLSQYYISVS